MHIPKYWGRAERQARRRNGQVFDIRKWHWSDESVADAEAGAQQRAEVVVSRIAAGEPFPTRYAYASDQPLREELVREVPGSDGKSVITRNAYGALVLNSEQVMFVDIDFETSGDDSSSHRHGNSAAATSGGSDLPSFEGNPGEIAKSILSWGIRKLFGDAASQGNLPRRQDAPGTPGQLDAAEQRVIAQLEKWVAQNPAWAFRAYRTASGVRLLVTNGLHQPDSAQTLQVMAELRADSLYLRLCRTQKSFRARLTPKPWRLGMAAPRVRFPYSDPGESEEMRRWLRRYEKASHNRATARFVRELGSGLTEVPAEVEAVVRIHDEITRAHETQFPLA